MMDIIELQLTDLLTKLKKRPQDAYKGDFGHVLIIGGNNGYAGAPVMSALGALRVGAGLVTVATLQQNIIGLNSSHPELMSHAIDKPNSLEQIIDRVDVCVLGPGLGRDSWSKQVYDFAQSTKHPLVLDADGLYFLAQNPNLSDKRVITPHPGEAARLLDKASPIDQKERVSAITALINKYGSTTVLKGNGSLIASDDHNITICKAGNPGMASGGMGDLLSGIIGGLIAQGLDLTTAAQLGTCLHATAGDIAASDGERGLIATDLLKPIRSLIG